MMKSLKGYSGKPKNDPITALNMLKERQDIPGIKRELQEDAVQSGCSVLWLVKTFDN